MIYLWHLAETISNKRRDFLAYLSLGLMRVALIVILSLLAACSNGQRVSPHSVILKPKNAPKVIKSCNPEIPPDITDYWTPSVADAQQMEALLPNFLLNSPIHRQFSDYYRQYVGVIANGRKLVFVSAFVTPSEWHMHWKSDPVAVCGGGSDYWRVAFDPQTKEFSHWNVNGPL